MCQSSWVTIFISLAKLNDRCFCYVTAAMFVSHRRAQTWRLHTKLYKFGWHTSANGARMKNSRHLILGKVVYIAVIYHILDSWIYLLNGYDFSFWSHDWWKPRISVLTFILILVFHFVKCNANQYLSTRAHANRYLSTRARYNDRCLAWPAANSEIRHASPRFHA